MHYGGLLRDYDEAFMKVARGSNNESNIHEWPRVKEVPERSAC